MNELLDELKSLLQTALGANFKTYYKGNVIVPPKKYLPALMIFGNSTNVIAKTTAEDQYQYNVSIKVVVDVMTFVDEAGTGEIIKSQETLIDLMEQRNSSNQPVATTVLGVLRDTDNIRGARYIHNNNINVTYSAAQTGEFFYNYAIMNLEFITDLVPRTT